jgi:hypothetical protein
MLSDPSVTILMYFVLPVWFIAGFADWICHRATSIETASGVKESAIHALMWALVKRLNEFGKHSKPRLAEVAWDTACGGTGHELTLVTDPPKGKVRIWPALYHGFCSAQGVKADSVRECNQWIEIADGEADLFSGAYWFQASWQRKILVAFPTVLRSGLRDNLEISKWLGALDDSRAF